MYKTIKKISIIAIVALISVISLNAQTAYQWKIDKAHTSINFSINHFFSTVTGRFNDFDGTFFFDPANLKGSKADFTISVKSINTDVKKRDDHLQTSDFFDAEKYPNIKFQSTKFEKKSGNNYIVYGNLTIKNTTKLVKLPFKVLGEVENPMMKGTWVLSLAAETKIKRNDYGVGTGNWAATVVVGNEVDIKINMELDRTK